MSTVDKLASINLREEYDKTEIRSIIANLEADLVGLAPVKNRIRQIAALLLLDRVRKNLGLTSGNPGLHMSFTGSAGTGKTTVGLKMADILYKLGYIRKGHLLTVTRDDLVGQYIGHTAPKTKEVLKKAMGGVLFIDEAYYLYKPNNERDYGSEAIEILRGSKPNKKRKFKYIIDEWGADLQSEHERFLVEKHFKCPVILFDYPAKIKAFYMRLNEDGKTVRAMDVLFPGIGEIVGGAQREERLDVLKEKMAALDIDEKELWWYLDTRKFGTAVHSGFGLGFERLVQFATGMGNIRDVIPFPRTPQNAEF